ncbi:MAG: glycerol-3-phosphate acyltransferase [Chloroflexia bacterium]
MGDLLLAAPLVLAAYLVGCFSTGYYLGRWTSGSDVRASGSGSSGARNVARTLGPAGAALTLLGRFRKGALVAWAPGLLGYDEWAVAAAMVAVVAGHVWPAQLRFAEAKEWRPRPAARSCTTFGLCSPLRLSLSCCS